MAFKEMQSLEKEVEAKQGNIHNIQNTVDIMSKISGADVRIRFSDKLTSHLLLPLLSPSHSPSLSFSLLILLISP